MTNVNPGDVALVVDNEHPITRWSLGRVVTIEARCDCPSAAVRGEFVWSFVEPLRHKGLVMTCAPDWCLKRLPPLAELDAMKEPQRATLHL